MSPETGLATAEFRQEIEPCTATAQQLVVKDQASYDLAVDYLRGLKARQRKIDETFDPHIARAHASHKALVAEKKGFSDVVQRSEGIVKQKLLTFEQEQEEARRVEEQRLAGLAQKEESDRKLAAAADAQARGLTPEDVEAILTEPSTAPPPAVEPSYERAAGVATRETWKAQVTDMAALVRHIAKNPSLLNLLKVNDTALNALARAQRQMLKLPGVRVYADKNLAVRG